MEVTLLPSYKAHGNYFCNPASGFQGYQINVCTWGEWKNSELHMTEQLGASCMTEAAKTIPTVSPDLLIQMFHLAVMALLLFFLILHTK